MDHNEIRRMQAERNYQNAMRRRRAKLQRQQLQQSSPTTSTNTFHPFEEVSHEYRIDRGYTPESLRQL